MINYIAVVLAKTYRCATNSDKLISARLAQRFAMVAGTVIVLILSSAAAIHAESANSLSEHADALLWVLGASFALIQLLIGVIYLNGQKVIAQQAAQDKSAIAEKLKTETKALTEKAEADKLSLAKTVAADKGELIRIIESMEKLATQMVNAVGDRVNAAERDIQNLYGLSGKVPEKYLTKEDHDKRCPRV